MKDTPGTKAGSPKGKPIDSASAVQRRTGNLAPGNLHFEIVNANKIFFCRPCKQLIQFYYLFISSHFQIIYSHFITATLSIFSSKSGTNSTWDIKLSISITLSLPAQPQLETEAHNKPKGG